MLIKKKSKALNLVLAYRANNDKAPTYLVAIIIFNPLGPW